jgi:hypothetical protein
MDDGSPRAFSVPSGLALVTLRSNKWVLEIVDGSLKKGLLVEVWFGLVRVYLAAGDYSLVWYAGRRL